MSDLFGSRRDPYGKVVGQRVVIDRLKRLAANPVHAYLFLGMEGVGKAAVAEGFSASLVCEGEDKPCGACWHCEAVMDGRHPDVNVFRREGASISVDEAREVGSWSLRSPSVAARRVVILPEFHLAEGSAPALLKSLEEPPAATVFLILANSLPSSMQTIASRCIVVELDPLTDSEVQGALVEDGISPGLAAEISSLSSGNLARARRLASDPDSLKRIQLWRSVPGRLEPGNGSLIMGICEELIAAVENAVSIVEERQGLELKELAEAKKQKVATKTEETELEKAHRRQRRRIRTDELRTGLAAMANAYLEPLRSSGDSADNGGVSRRIGPAGVVKSVELIRATSGSLDRNPVESLALQALFIRLADILEPSA